MSKTSKAAAKPTIDLAKLPAYANFQGAVPTNLLLELALKDSCEDVKHAICMGTQRQTGETYSTHHALVSGYEDLDPVWDDD